MQVLAGLVFILGFYLEIWDFALGIDICQESPPEKYNGVNICAYQGTNLESFKMDCKNESIVIKDIFVGSKVNNTYCHDKLANINGEHEQQCCGYDSKDVLFDSKCPGIQNASGPLAHFVYSDTITTCSAQHTCDKKLSFKVPLPKHHKRGFADYVRVFYDCISDAASIGFCESRSVKGSVINMRYDMTLDTLGDNDEHECSCHVTSSGPDPVEITALDVRLQDSSDNMECHYTKLSVVDAKDKNQIYKNMLCLNKEFIFGVPVIHNSKSKDFIISLGPIKRKQYPSVVWLQVSAKSNRTEITVSCNGPTQEPSNRMAPEAAMIAILSAVILTGIIVTIVALCKRRKQREYKPPQPENIYFELETPDDKYDQLHLKQLQDENTLKPDPSYGRLDYSNPDESHYAEPDKLNGKHAPFIMNNDYATPDSCRS